MSRSWELAGGEEFKGSWVKILPDSRFEGRCFSGGRFRWWIEETTGESLDRISIPTEVVKGMAAKLRKAAWGGEREWNDLSPSQPQREALALWFEAVARANATVTLFSEREGES